MKTSVNMIRRMGNFEVTQRTKDSFFNATELIKQWNEYSGQKKEVTKFFELENTKEFIKALLLEENLNTQDSAYLKTRGKYGGTWMTPILFIKFAMWLNPNFEVKVIKFVYDNLIAFRHNAGDNYVGLTNAVARFQDISYPQLAKSLNWIVFNRHEGGIRQTATEDELHELTELQKKLAFAVDMGYIRTFTELLNELRRLWSIKWDKNFLGYGHARV
jgi:hypothetical protein